MMFVFFLLYTPINLRRTAKKSAKESVEIEWRVNNAGISVIKGEDTTKYPWESFSYTEEANGYYLLFLPHQPGGLHLHPQSGLHRPRRRDSLQGINH